MKTLMMLFLFCHGLSAVKHSMMFYLMTSSGVSNIPEYMVITEIDRVTTAYYDSSTRTLEPKSNWVKKFIEDDPHYWDRRLQGIMNYHDIYKAESNNFKLHLNQTDGVHINQQISGCEWDNDTHKAGGCKNYAHNGKDFLIYDLETETWIAANPQAKITKQMWDGKKIDNEQWKNFLTSICPVWLKKYLDHGKSHLQRRDLPSVSLLQKSPSSPVSCHATGFYPNRATMFWRKDREELHEDVDIGEILPNNDGSFQISVDLKLSSVTAEDWRRYDCVFQLSGVNDDIVTKLDKAVIRTNYEEPTNITTLITAAVVALAVVLFAAVGFSFYNKEKANRPPPPPVNSSELSETLTPET